MMYLLDTNVISELRKLSNKKADINVVQWLITVYPSELFISTVTIMEIKIGILQLEQRGDFTQANLLRKWYQEEILAKFSQRILPISTDVAEICAELHVPNKRPFSDAYIAATAIAHNFTLVTRDTKDFKDIKKLKLLNPFEQILQ